MRRRERGSLDKRNQETLNHTPGFWFPATLVYWFCPLPAELWTRVRLLLKPNPDVAHYILTHFQWLWDIVNRTFLRDFLMRVVITGL